MTRNSKLFEAGDYPDKGVNITEDDIQAYVDNFTPFPLKIEHSDTPFDGSLGMVQSVVKKGKDLFGEISIDNNAWELMKKSGAKKLSVGIDTIANKLVEVSVVKNPRVASARIFNFSIEIEEPKEIEDSVKEINISQEALIDSYSNTIEAEKTPKEIKAGFIKNKQFRDDGLVGKLEEFIPNYSWIDYIGIDYFIWCDGESYFKCRFIITDGKVFTDMENESVELDWVSTAEDKGDEIEVEVEEDANYSEEEVSDNKQKTETDAKLNEFNGEEKIMDEKINETIDFAIKEKEDKILELSNNLKANEELLAEARKIIVDNAVTMSTNQLVSDGKIVPSQVEIVKAIFKMSGDNKVTFNENEETLISLFSKFLDEMPKQTVLSKDMKAIEEEVVVEKKEFDSTNETIKKLNISEETFNLGLEYEKQKENK